jgi:hypothetical protein
MELSALLAYVNKRRGTQADPVSTDDVVGGSFTDCLCEHAAKVAVRL